MTVSRRHRRKNLAAVALVWDLTAGNTKRKILKADNNVIKVAMAK